MEPGPGDGNGRARGAPAWAGHWQRAVPSGHPLTVRSASRGSGLEAGSGTRPRGTGRGCVLSVCAPTAT